MYGCDHKVSEVGSNLLILHRNCNKSWVQNISVIKDLPKIVSYNL